MPDLSTVGKRIEFARSQRRFRQRDLADLLQMKNTTQISQWESDVYVPNARRLGEIAIALKVDPAWLISGSGNPPLPGRSHGSPEDEVFPITTLLRQPAVRAWLNDLRAHLLAASASPEQEDAVLRTVQDRPLIARFADGAIEDQYTLGQVLAAMESIALVAKRFLAPENGEGATETTHRAAQLEEEDIPAERPSAAKQSRQKPA